MLRPFATVTLVCALLSATALAVPASAGPRAPAGALERVAPCDGASLALRDTWQAAADRYRVPWTTLAAVTRVASDYGCDLSPGEQGRAGWVKLPQDVWARYRVDADADGEASPHDSRDAMFTLARALRAEQRTAGVRGALAAIGMDDRQQQWTLSTRRSIEKVTPGQHRQIAELSKTRARVQARVDALRARLDQEPHLRKLARESWQQARQALPGARERAQRSQRESDEAQRNLNMQTLAYAQTAQGVQMAGQQEGSPDIQALRVVAGASEADAVVAWQAARALMDHQAATVRTVRQAAADADARRAQAETALAEAAALERQRADALVARRELTSRRRSDLHELERRERGLDRLAARWELLMGAGDALDGLDAAGSMDGLPLEARLILLARRELERGVREEPMGSNDSPRIAQYRLAVRNNPGVGPWCAYFVSWVAATAGVPIGYDGSGYARVDDITAWAQATGRFVPAGPDAPVRPGMLILFDEHVGVVEDVSPGGQVTSIEGNTSNVVGRRFDRQSTAIGYAHVGDPPASGGARAPAG